MSGQDKELATATHPSQQLANGLVWKYGFVVTGLPSWITGAHLGRRLPTPSNNMAPDLPRETAKRRNVKTSKRQDGKWQERGHAQAGR